MPGRRALLEIEEIPSGVRFIGEVDAAGLEALSQRLDPLPRVREMSSSILPLDGSAFCWIAGAFNGTLGQRDGLVVDLVSVDDDVKDGSRQLIGLPDRRAVLRTELNNQTGRVDAESDRHPVIAMIIRHHRECLGQSQFDVIDLIDRETCVGAERRDENPHRGRVLCTKRHRDVDDIVGERIGRHLPVNVSSREHPSRVCGCERSTRHDSHVFALPNVIGCETLCRPVRCLGVVERG